jgi:hypothetical protein
MVGMVGLEFALDVACVEPLPPEPVHPDNTAAAPTNNPGTATRIDRRLGCEEFMLIFPPYSDHRDISRPAMG